MAEVALAVGFTPKALYGAIKDGRLARYVVRDERGRIRLLPEAASAIRGGLIRLRSDSARCREDAEPELEPEAPALELEPTDPWAHIPPSLRSVDGSEPFWATYGRIEPDEQLSPAEFWEHLAAMLSALMDELYDAGAVAELCHQLDELRAAIAAGARWDQARWDAATARLLLSELPCPLAAADLAAMVDAGRVPAELLAQVEDALAGN